MLWYMEPNEIRASKQMIRVIQEKPRVKFLLILHNATDWDALHSLAKKYKNFKKLSKNVKYDFLLNEASFTALFVFTS